MALSIAQLWTKNTKAELKSQLISIASAAGMPVTTFVAGDPSERWLEIIPRVLDQVLSSIIQKAVQAFFFDQLTDPGDPGNDNPDVADGWLSGFGFGWYGVTRRGQTFATGTITITNNNAYAIFPKPGEIQVESTETKSDGGHPTYTTTADDSIYVNANGSVTIAPSASIDLPVIADTIGTYSNASSSGLLTQVNTGTFGTLACTNAAAVLAEDREAAADFRTRARRASARVATGSPTALYEYAANTGADGLPLQRHDGSGVVGITRIFVDDAITEAGAVTVYLADDDGGVDTVDKDSADANITGIPLGVITNPIGVVDDSTDYTTASATATSVHVVGSAKIKTADAGGLTTTQLKQVIIDALAAYIASFPIGGLDQASGAGVLYTSDMEAIVKDARPGFYAVSITTPATSSTALALGHVATLNSATGDWSVTIT